MLDRELYISLIQQEHHNIIPFSCIIESGVGSGSTFDFELDATQDYFNAKQLIANVNSTITKPDTSTYVPQDESAEFEHNNSFHVEIIAKDSSGIKQYNVRSQDEIYEYENFKDAFNIPKFSWSNEMFGNSSVVSDVDINDGSVWVGDANNKLRHLKYNSDSADEIFNMDLQSEIHTILFEKNKSNSFITTHGSLVQMSIDDFWSIEEDEKEILESQAVTNLSVSNEDRDILALIDGDKLISLQSYSGKVIERNSTTLDISSVISGFDAPHKILWSKYHQSYFIAGTNILWELKSGTKRAVYQIKGYRIADFDVSQSGYICLILDGETDDIIRILKPNLYSIALSETISDGTARFCKYCDQGIFYILVELNSTLTYVFLSYLFNTKTSILEVIEENAEVSTTTTTTTPSIPTNKVKVVYPVADDYVNLGDEIEILWNSVESATDNVRIELYKAGVIDSTVINETNNNGIYKWEVPETITEGSDYQIKVTWLSSTEFPVNSDIGGKFIVSNEVTTTTTTTKSNYHSIGIDFNSRKRHVVNVLNNGLVGYLSLNNKMFYGLYQAEDSDISDATCMAVREDFRQVFSSISAIRVFVGSEEHLSDKWDSGIIETENNSIYYGGGDNLIPGETYFVNIQVKDDNYGWSGVQTREWIMPK